MASKALRWILSLVLVAGLVPVTAFALDDAENESVATEEPELVTEEQGSEAEELIADEGEPVPQAEGDGGVQEGPTVLEEGDFGEEDALHWVYKDDASLTISGTGSMPDFAESGGQPWNKYLRTMEKLTLEEGVESVGAYAFYEADYLGVGEIVFPDSLVSVADHAFYSCDSLGEVTFLNKVQTLGASVFAECTKIGKVIVPDSVTSIGIAVFEGCYRVTECELSNQLEVLPERTFSTPYSTGLTMSVTFPASIRRIENKAFFGGHKFVDFSFPPTLEAIGAEAFSGCTVKGDLSVPASIKSIGSSTFATFRVEGTLTFEEGVSASVFSALVNYGATASETWVAHAIRIPASLTWQNPFQYGGARDAYEVAADSECFVAIDGVLYSKGPNNKYESKSAVLVSCPTDMSGPFAVAEGTRSVEDGALSKEIDSVTIPSTADALKSSAFRGHALRRIDVDERNGTYASVDGILFDKTLSKVILCPRAHAFDGDYDLPDTVRTLEPGAFADCRNLKSIRIPEGVQTLTSNFINDCESLIAIYLPSSLRQIEMWNFWASYLPDDHSGVSVFFGGTEEQLGSVTLSPHGNNAYERARFYCNARWHGTCADGLMWYADTDNTLSVIIDERADSPSVTMRDYRIGEAPWMIHKDLFDTVQTAPQITSVGANAFAGCENITTATLSWGITEVGACAFADCPNLSSVDCLGNAFSVVPADSPQPSFDAEKVKVTYKPNASGWTDGAAFDADSGRWNGYVLELGEMPSLPTVASIELRDASGAAVTDLRIVGISGNRQRYQTNDHDLSLRVLAADGSDITDKVDISIASPARKTPLIAEQDEELFGLNMFNNLNRTRSMAVTFDDIDNTVRVGCCSPEGEHEIVVTPKAFEAAGDPMTCKISVTRANERIFHSVFVETETRSGLAGRDKGDDSPYVDTFEVCSQYMENVTPKVQTRLVDKLSGTDVTDSMATLGITLSSDAPEKLKVDRMANPRDYELHFSGPANAVSGQSTLALSLRRLDYLLSRPYRLNLTGGTDHMEVDTVSEGAWSPVPYRVKVLDAYDDPCWPDLSWEVRRATGQDATSGFQVDDQGYVFVGRNILSTMQPDTSLSFAVSSSAAGVGGTKTSNALSLTLHAKEPAPPAPVTHTATFKVGDEVIGQVAFAEGDMSLEAPVLPSKANYVGQWEVGGKPWAEFDLASATTDVEVTGVYAPLDPDAVSEIEGGGDAEYKDGAVTVNLRASASSRNVRIESSSTKPVDVVLVCDQSGSMGDKLGGGVTKQAALKNCALSFANKLAENAKKTGAQHRVALVGFAYSSYNNGRYVNTGLLATNVSGKKDYPQLRKSDYENALMPINAGDRINPRVTGGIATIAASGATAADKGLAIAEGIFSNNPVGSGTQAGDRERIVIFITDGTPTSWSNQNSDLDRVKNTAIDAITKANVIKQSQGARIYSIGVEAGAKAGGGDLYGRDGAEKGSNGLVRFDFNRFLHAVSSDFPVARSMRNVGAGSKESGYYMPVTNTAALDGIFTKILMSTVYSVETFDHATLRYEVPAGLALTLKQEEEMRTDLEAQGISANDISVLRENGKTVLTFRNVPVKQALKDGVPVFVAQVSFKLSAVAGAAGDIPMGSVDVDCLGESSEYGLTSVNVPADRCLVVFNMDGVPYEIREMQMGDAIVAPDTDLARWLAFEKLQDPKVTGPVAVFETTSLARTYAMRWVVNSSERTMHLTPGSVVAAPDMSDLVPEGYEVAGWSPAPPLSMPSNDVTCTAVITESHKHAYTASSYKTGYCTDGMDVHNVCTCGDEEVTREAPLTEHAFTTVLSNEGAYTATTKRHLVCKDCGYSMDMEMEYEAAEGDDDVVVLDLTKMQADTEKPGESNDDIEIKVFMDAEDDDEFTVTRIDEDDTRTEYSSHVRDGYLWFYPNHFSIYVIGKRDASGVSVAEGVTYADSLERLERAATEDPGEGELPDDPGKLPQDPDNGNPGIGGDGNGGNQGGQGEGSGSGSGSDANDGGDDSGDGAVPTDPAQPNQGAVGGEPLPQTGDIALGQAFAFLSVAFVASAGAWSLRQYRRKKRA